MKLSPSVQLAQDRLREFKDQHSATLPELSKALGLDAKYLRRLLKQRAGPNMFATPVLEKLGSSEYEKTGAALDALRNPAARTPAPEAHEEPPVLPASTSTRKIQIESGDHVKSRAMRRLDELRQVTGMGWCQLSLSMGNAKGYLNGVRNRYKNDLLSQHAALHLANLIDAMMKKIESGETKHSHPFDDVLPVPGGALPSPEGVDNMQQTPAKTTAAPAESESGIKNADHEALRPHFELLIFALRNNIPARVVIDPVEVE